MPGDKSDPEKAAALKKMLEAVAIAPRSGLLLLELANRYAIVKDMVEAFDLCLRTVRLYPRWPVARYRLAVTATMLASEGASRWQAKEPTRHAICAALDWNDVVGGGDLAIALRSTDAAGQRQALCAFAIANLDAAKKLVGMKCLLPSLLRSSERSYWLTMLHARERITFRTQFGILADSAKAMADVRAVPLTPAPADLDKAVKNGGVTWQLAYNLACVHAERALSPSGVPEAQEAEIATALTLLELAVSRPGGDQLTSTWLMADPDLAPLRDEPRFVRLADRLPSEHTDR